MNDEPPRKNEQQKLRMSPEARKQLAARAAECDLTMSEYVEQTVTFGKLPAPVETN